MPHSAVESKSIRLPHSAFEAWSFLMTHCALEAFLDSINTCAAVCSTKLYEALGAPVTHS